MKDVKGIFKTLINSENMKYIYIGIITTFISIFIYSILIKFNFSLDLANYMANFISIVFAFFANKFYVFNSKNKSIKRTFLEFMIFFGIRIIFAFIETELIKYLVNILHINKGIAKYISTIFVIILNYIISKFFLFNKK